MDDEKNSIAKNLDMSSDLDQSSSAAEKEENTIFDDSELDDEDIISAPIEVLAEFLSAVMSRRYQDALHYCTIILQYEPDNKIAREFYPLIEEKLKLEEISTNNNEDSDENDSYSGADNGKNISCCSLSSSSDNEEIMKDNTELSQDLQKISIS